MKKLIMFILSLFMSVVAVAAPGGYPWGFEQPLTSADLNAAFAARVTFSRGALTAHGVILGNGLGDEYAIGSLGSAGQVLTSNGPNTDPSMQAFSAVLAQASAPLSPATGNLWLNIAGVPYLLEQYDGVSWVIIGSLNAATHTWFGTGVNQAVQGGVIAAGGPIGSSTVIPIITYNAAGQITGISSAAIAPSVGSITGLGTGVGTALGVNVGSAGAFIVNGGAGGTPSSLTLTNATGLPVSGIASLGTGVGTALGVNVGSAGAFIVNGGGLGTPSGGNASNLTAYPASALAGTTLASGVTASSLVSAAGGTFASGAFAAAFNPAAPGAIGGTTPAAGNFTTIGATGNVTFSGLATSGTISGSVCLDASGHIINNAGTNCYASGGASTYLVKTTTYTAVNGDNIFADTAGGAFTITLPASPSQFNQVCVLDASGTFGSNTLTIARNGSNIMGSASDMTVTTAYASFCLMYYAATPGWRIK